MNNGDKKHEAYLKQKNIKLAPKSEFKILHKTLKFELKIRTRII